MRCNTYVFLIFASAVIGCSGSGVKDPIALSSAAIDWAPSTTNSQLWGIWDVYVSADRESVEIAPLRSADLHLNAVRLLEVAPCKTCVTISGVHVTGPDEFEADVTLTHPYPGLLKYTAFDVRGIFVSQADYTFPTSGRKTALGDGVPRMLDPDGYTALFNPTEYPATTPPALGYIAGKYSNDGDLSTTLNPFMAYRKDAPRCMFEAGNSETKIAKIHAPAGPMHFGYVVDGCWQLVEDVVDPVKDFPPDANCLEAYRVSVEVGSEIPGEIGGETPIEVRAYDHQGQDTIESVKCEAPDLFQGELSLTFSTVMPDAACLFSGTLPNNLGVPAGDYPLLVRIVDKESDQNLGAVDAWQVSQVTATPSHRWALTWGGMEQDRGLGVAVDNWGHIYVTGFFTGAVDFDPGPGTDDRTSAYDPIGNYSLDAFLSRFDPAGNFEWVRTWGWTGSETGVSVAVDGSGGVYVAGTFEGNVDFDPSPSKDIHSSKGADDAFLSKFDASGNFLWARTWGGVGIDYAEGLAVDGFGNAYVAGSFWDTVDFDPGPGVDEHTPCGHVDAYLSKFDTDGNFLWARTWGSEEDNDAGFGVAVDAGGNAYVTGQFWATVDFDPGPGIDNHSSNGEIDIFLSKFDADGNFAWAQTWGGPTSYDRGSDVAVDGLGDLYVTGQFDKTVDFDPGLGEDIHSSSKPAVFLSRFDTSGDFIWARTWGGVLGVWPDWGYRVAADKSGNAYVTGIFNGSCDFDPGPGVDVHSANGGNLFCDVFLSKFNASGDFLWARTWGGPDLEGAYGVAVSSSQSAYVTGFFGEEADFDPGAGTDFRSSNGAADVFLVKFLPDGN